MAKRCYEVLIALDPPIAVADADALVVKLKGIVHEIGGEIKAAEKLGLRRLAFRVKGRSEAQFMLLSCEMNTPAVKAIEGVLRLHEGVIRYMTTRIEPTLMAQSLAGAPIHNTAPAPAPHHAPAPVAAPSAPAA